MTARGRNRGTAHTQKRNPDPCMRFDYLPIFSLYERFILSNLIACPKLMVLELECVARLSYLIFVSETAEKWRKSATFEQLKFNYVSFDLRLIVNGDDEEEKDNDSNNKDGNEKIMLTTR